MELRYLNIDELIAGAGGDPWKLDRTIQSGAPGEISDLATTFYNAGVCMGDTSEEFNQAKKRFEAAWDRDDGGGHPINDSAEVQRAATALHLDREQLARISVDLQSISASLAETQQSSVSSIDSLEGALRQIDNAIDAAVLQSGLTFDEHAIAPMKAMAVQEIKDALSAIGTSRDAYAGELARAMTSMQAEGYMPDAVERADGNGVDTGGAAAQEAAEYDARQRVADQALVTSEGPITPEKEAAAARIRDYATIQNPDADPAAVRLAGERLDDFQMAHQPPGSLPRDPVLGSDPQRRALVREEWQRQLEKGSPWSPPMTPDEATSWMDEQEARARAEAIALTIEGLQSRGLSREAATDVADAMARGFSMSDLAYAGEVSGPLSEIKQIDGALSDGKHALPWERYSTSDLKAMANVGKSFGAFGTAAEFAVAYADWRNGAGAGSTFGAAAGSVSGGFLVGALGGMAGGAALGPGGAFVGAVVGGLVGSTAGKSGGAALGGLFDK
ncbi:hypothetical protein DQP55_00460 [Mycolicibacterium sp. GF69]|uniref:putative alpha/beta hydrolase n=1 Tax=Mycolicibacterium sp. GF69 TaxID=2267251 RepID=UPI000DCE9324|nr:hypothetical protein [Mycolicibacterium sp. GF69]RAV18003.1 hypothetical protein DQP55_00460 [Mycolicibacterium sp. GF69]